MPPQTRAWIAQGYEQLKRVMLQSPEKLTCMSNKLMLVGDFNCKDVNCKDMEAGNEKSWGSKLMDIYRGKLWFSGIRVQNEP